MSNQLKLILIFFSILFIVLSSSTIEAQCAMCRMAAESNLEHGGSSGKGLNLGILYMLVLPYLSVGIIAFILYRKRLLKKES